MIVAVAGGLAGVIVAAVASELLVLYVARYTLRASEIRIDGTVLYFTVGVSLVIGIVSGMLPALGV